MHALDIRFLGEGFIQYNGQDLHLPYAKAMEVMFVLAHEKRVGRLELCDLIWDLEECDEEKAKKNLRHVIYTIRKYTNEQLIQSPKRDTVMISEACVIRSDLTALIGYSPITGEPADIRRFLALNSGPFMLFCRGAGPKLAQWIDSHAQTYHLLYTGKLRQTIDRQQRDGEYELAEQCCRRLLALEEYDEACCVSLMTIYQKTGRYAEALEVYQSLEARLASDLSVRPLPETSEAYRKIKGNTIKQKKQAACQGLYGRNRELQNLRQHFSSFAAGLPFRHCLISGEAGIGKTSLVQTFLHDLAGNCLTVDICCHELEESFRLRLWDRILANVAAFIVNKGLALPPGLVSYIGRVFPTFQLSPAMDEDGVPPSVSDTHDIEKNICSLFNELCGRHRQQVLMAVDDLQWIDDDSLTLLSKVLFSNPGAIMLVSSHRDEESEKLKRFYYHMAHLGGVERLEMSRFSEDKTLRFIRQAYPEAARLANQIYVYSEGNPLFLVEIINNIRENVHIDCITGKMARLVGGRILRLSAEARKFLELCSMFYDDVSVHTLTKLMDFSESKMMDAVEELVHKNILRESVSDDGTIMLTFTHSIIRKYVYDNMPKAKRVIMHGRIGKYLETLLRGVRLDRVAYPKLIHHYGLAENQVKLFEYKLKQMQLTFNVCHELFPVLEAGQDEGLFDEYGNEHILRAEFKTLKENYDDISAGDDPQTRELRLLFLYLYGRFSNGSGNLPVAREALNTLMALAQTNRQFLQYSFRGAIQLIQYAINSNDLTMMRQNIKRALEAAGLAGDTGQSALAYRHLGYYHILQGNYQRGENVLKLSRRQFEALTDQNKYKLHIAATLFFTGESRCRQNKFNEALAFYQKTMELCDLEANITSAAVLYLRFGYIYYRLGELAPAMDFLSRSIKAYERIIFIWGRADAYYYLHKVCHEKKLHDQSRKYLKTANKIMDEHNFKLSL